MSKVIRVTSILALAFEFFYFLLGKTIAPVFGLMTSGYSVFTGSTGATHGLVYLVFSFILGAVASLILTAFAIYLAVSANSDSESIGLEIFGYILLGVVIPLLSYIINLISTIFIGVASVPATLAIISTSKSYGTFFGILHTVAIGMIFIAFSFSICRKKYSTFEVYGEDDIPEE